MAWYYVDVATSPPLPNDVTAWSNAVFTVLQVGFDVTIFVNISATTAYFCFGCLVFCKRSTGIVIPLLPSPTVLKGIVVAVCNHQRMSVFQHKFIFLLSTILQLTFETDRIAVRIDNGTDQFMPESSTQEISKSIDDGIFLGGLGVKSQLVTGKTKLRYFFLNF